MLSRGLLLAEGLVDGLGGGLAGAHGQDDGGGAGDGIAVKDKKALSAATRRFVDYVRGWVAENGGE